MKKIAILKHNCNEKSIKLTGQMRFYWPKAIKTNDKTRIYIVERIWISYFLALSRVARFYATTEQKLIHSFWEFVGKSTNYTKVRVIHRLYTTLHITILGFADIGSMEKLFWFFSVSLLIHVKLKKSTVEFHISNKQLRQERMIRPSSTFIQYL